MSSVGGFVLAIGALAIMITMVNNQSEQAEGGSESDTGPPPVEKLPIEPGPGPVPTYGPTPAPNGCELIPTEMLLDKGWKLTRENPITDRHPDPAAPVSKPVGDSIGGVVNGISGCAIPFEERASVQLSIKRPPHDDPRLIQQDTRQERERYPSYSENGWQVSLHRDLDDANMVAGSMSKGTDLIEFMVVSPKDTQRQRAIRTGKQVVSEVIANWDRSFTGANIALYPEPYGKVPDPCAALTAQDFTEVLRLPESGMINRDRYPGYTASIQEDTGERMRYIESSCLRSQLELDELADGVVDIRLRTFGAAPAATRQLDSYRDPNGSMVQSFGPPTPLHEKVGASEAFLSPAVDGRMMFQAGRHIVILGSTEYSGATSEQEMLDRLVSVGRKIADRIAER